MPLRVARWTGADFQTRIGPSRTVADPVFVSGVSIPFYEPTVDLNAAPKNVGNREGVALTTYTGTITNGVAQLTNSSYTNVLFPCVIDVRANTSFYNCRVVVPQTYTASDSIKGCVRGLFGGSGVNRIYMEDCEIHNRAQRPMNGFMGRNLTLRRTVVTGCVDGFSTAATGDAAQSFGYDIADSIVPEAAWWYSSTANSTDIHSDKECHADGFQHADPGLRVDIFNSVFGQYVSEIIGTGTPGSGVDAGNIYVPASGYNYIQSQATMEGWRDTYASTFSVASQSMWGTSHRLINANVAGQGSQACFMVNRDNFHADKCYLGGGLAAINLLDSNLPTSMDVDITNCVFYNDMRNGAGRAATTKGQAALVTAGKSLTWSGNKWFDGTTANITYL